MSLSGSYPAKRGLSALGSAARGQSPFVARARERLPGFPPQEGVGLRVLFQDFGSLAREFSQQVHLRVVLNFGEPINGHLDGHGALDGQPAGADGAASGDRD